jgi:hypothetical protein
MKNQKILNNAFYATLLMPGLSLIAWFLGILSANLLGSIELIMLPLLGYLTKKGSKKASILLLMLFSIDRFFLFKNWIYHLPNILSIIQAVFISFILWSYFYKAYFVLKTK